MKFIGKQALASAQAQYTPKQPQLYHHILQPQTCVEPTASVEPTARVPTALRTPSKEYPDGPRLRDGMMQGGL
jgi:hypothetical protein